MDSGLKTFTLIYDELAKQLSKCLENANIPELTTKAKGTLI